MPTTAHDSRADSALAGTAYIHASNRPSSLHMSLHHQKAHILLILLALYSAESLASTIPQCFENVISCAENSSSLECTSSLNISSTTALSVLRTSDGSLILPELGSIQGATALAYGGCLKYCGPGSQEPFNWNDFAQEYTTWLLPYLALLSQLPFGARRRTDDLMSAILTLGSPTLAGYSLYLTLLNARWVNDYMFADIHYPSAAVRRSVVRVLSNLQQVPLRVHPRGSGQFESLVVHPDNDEWWNIFAEELEYSQTWSIASVTSILWVMTAYLLSVAYAISNLTGNYRNGEGTASGLLWLLPVVVGWLILSPKCDYRRVLDAYNRANRRAFVANSVGITTTHVTANFGLTISPSPPWEQCTNIIPQMSLESLRSSTMREYGSSKKSNRRVGVDGKQFPGNVCNDVPRECRLGNLDQINNYCRPASLMGLQLQWGTTSAALLGSWFTPTIVRNGMPFSYVFAVRATIYHSVDPAGLVQRPWVLRPSPQ
ncbi:hypothetical protein JVU11DRAFT_10354 [Chiua virens]|nr:hypothetical protein JVU11DRAFT_10354 [Chiua virens]